MSSSISSGPVRTLPGSLHSLDNTDMCDEHDTVPAVKKVQGETDSFGCEFMFMCQKCYDDYKRKLNVADHSGICDWCKKSVDRVVPHRDIEEGASGRVYDVCLPCIELERARWREEDEN